MSTQLGNTKVAESRGSVGLRQPPFRIHRHNLRTSLKHLNLVLQTEKKERGGGRIGLGFKD